VGQQWEEYLKKFNRFPDFQVKTCEKRMLNGLLIVAGDIVELTIQVLQQNTANLTCFARKNKAKTTKSWHPRGKSAKR